MKAPVKSAVESAILAAVVAIVCLWMLVSANQGLDEPSAARLTLLSLGLGIGVVAHWTYLALALRADGRSLLGWIPALVLLCPFGSVVALVLLSSGKPETGTDREGAAS